MKMDILIVDDERHGVTALKSIIQQYSLHLILILLYHQKHKGQHTLVFNSLSKQGQLEKGAVVIANEKNYEWMPRMLKQVSDNEAILPYQYKNRIGFAKVKFK